MNFTPTPIGGAFLLEIQRLEDERGFFARVFNREEFERAGINGTIRQINTSLSRRRGTLRGMHYQLPPAAEVKVVRCMRGALLDVVVDLRPRSATYKQWFSAELNQDNRRMMVVPEGCAHGFITLADDTEVIYCVTHPYAPDRERAVRYNDAAFGIRWPMEPIVISEKDRAARDFDPDWHLSPEMHALG